MLNVSSDIYVFVGYGKVTKVSQGSHRQYQVHRKLSCLLSYNYHLLDTWNMVIIMPLFPGL